MKGKPPLDTKRKLAAKMDELVLALVEQAERLPNAKLDVKLDVLKHATQYMSMSNRAPEGAEGGAIVDFRNRLGGSAGGSGSDGDGDGDADQADDAADGPEADPDDDTDTDYPRIVAG